jgi:diguanylate cyclase (GGDEF)-like protein/PAS domain S-box-containing protein
VFAGWLDWGLPAMLLLSAGISGVIAIFTWTRPRSDASRLFALAMSLVALWSLANLGELLTDRLQDKVFWINVQMIGIAILPAAWLAFAWQHGRGRALGRRRWILLLLVPLATILLAWSNPWHELVFRNLHVEPVERFSIIVRSYGPWFWVHALYTGGLLLATALLLHQASRTTHALFRGQMAALMAGALFPWLTTLVYALGFSGRYDPTPLAFTLSGIALAWGLYRLQLLDLVPAARDAVIASMRDGLIVLDGQNRVVDLNPAAARMLHCDISQSIGKPAEQVLVAYPDLIACLSDAPEAHAEVAIERDGVERWLELSLSPLYDAHQRISGLLVVLHDITEQKGIQQRLAYSSTHDPLTGLRNRAYFEQALYESLEPARFPLSVIIVDVDGLKESNDRLGHAAGDRLLQCSAAAIKDSFRASDVVARIGGDEFGVILPRAEARIAQEGLRRIQGNVEARNRDCEGLPLSLSYGAGTARAEDEIAAALQQADQAMYRVKAAKRGT